MYETKKANSSSSPNDTKVVETAVGAGFEF